MKTASVSVIQPYIALTRLNRPIGIFLLLWPTLIALCLASNGRPDLHITLIFVLGTIVMRSAGCTINDYADRDIDLHVTRTKHRPLAQRQISSKQALLLFVTLLFCALILALQLSLYTLLLACVAAALAIIYPFSKRFTNYPQFILGLAFAWSIPMAYAQVQGQITLETCVLFASTMAWVVAYDTQYAMTDKPDDIKHGIKSTAIAFGAYDKAIIFALQMLCLLGFIFIGQQRNFTWWFYIVLIKAAGLALYQQWLIKDRNPAKCLQAFLHNNYFGAAIFAGVLFAIL